MAPVKTTIVQVGNSQGILIPSSLLEQCHLQEEGELSDYQIRDETKSGLE